MRYSFLALACAAFGLGVLTVKLWGEDRNNPHPADLPPEVIRQLHEEFPIVYESEGVVLVHRKGDQPEASIHVIEPLAPEANMVGMIFYAPTRQFDLPSARYSAGNSNEEGHITWIDYGVDGIFDYKLVRRTRPADDGGGLAGYLFKDNQWVRTSHADVKRGRAWIDDVTYRFDTDALEWVVDEDAECPPAGVARSRKMNLTLF